MSRSMAEQHDDWLAHLRTADTPHYGWTGPNESDRNFAAGPTSGSTVVGDAKQQTGQELDRVVFSRMAV
jgi:hypothetical protein